MYQQLLARQRAVHVNPPARRGDSLRGLRRRRARLCANRDCLAGECTRRKHEHGFAVGHPQGGFVRENRRVRGICLERRERGIAQRLFRLSEGTRRIIRHVDVHLALPEVRREIIGESLRADVLHRHWHVAGKLRGAHAGTLRTFPGKNDARERARTGFERRLGTRKTGDTAARHRVDDHLRADRLASAAVRNHDAARALVFVLQETTRHRAREVGNVRREKRLVKRPLHGDGRRAVNKRIDG